MINSRQLGDLTPEACDLARRFEIACQETGIDVLIYSTYRDLEAQAALYAEGRTMPGSVRTLARPGESFHNYRVAFDCVPLRHGKPVWQSEDPLWLEIGLIGESLGLEWAGRWTGELREKCHFQDTVGLTGTPVEKLAQLKEGAKVA
jgi:peptidoglycan LD-endopeptidase CwlK